MVVLGVPLGSGAAHVMAFGPIRLESRDLQAPQEIMSEAHKAAGGENECDHGSAPCDHSK